MEKLDYKKAYRDLYQPKAQPTLIHVPAMGFIQVDGRGEPGGEAYQNALNALYGLSFTIKMSKMGDAAIPGYFEYVVPPLEGLWWSPGGSLDLSAPKSTWCWTSMIRQPEFVTEEVFCWAVEECRKKKPEVDVSGARFAVYAEGLCVQMMHRGSYDDEAPNIERMLVHLEENGMTPDPARKHHEIYLSDPRRTAVENRKTVIRIPARPQPL
jgi:hypothetical protein